MQSVREICPFILEYSNVISDSECDELFSIASNSSSHESGIVATSKGLGINDNVKKCIDIPGNEIDSEIVKSLVCSIESAAKNYTSKYPVPCEHNIKMEITGPLFQLYNVGDYFKWHVDNSLITMNRNRFLAIVMYLNDDFTGGETQFLYQKFAYKPVKGSAIIFPPFFTHAHRGAEVIEGKKLVASCFARFSDF